MRRFIRLILFLLAAAALVAGASAQQNTKPMTNDDVISMAKNLLPESVILSAIKTNDTNFDVSATGLIALKKAGVTAKVMEAMLAAASNKKNGSSFASAPSPSSAATPPQANGVPGATSSFFPSGATQPGGTPANTAQPTPAAPSAQPLVFFMQNGAKFNMTAEATQVAQTKSRANSLSALAEDQAVSEALRVGSTALEQAVSNAGSMVGSSAVNSGATIFSAVITRKQATKPNKITYVWALQGAASASTSPTNLPSFEVDYAGISGVNADAFEPVILKLALTQSAFRLVGATEAETTTDPSGQQGWPTYSGFMEDRVTATSQKLGSGQTLVRPSSALPAGQYAVALRPLDKSHKFSGEQVGKNEGEGLLFNYAWSFSVK